MKILQWSALFFLVVSGSAFSATTATVVKSPVDNRFRTYAYENPCANVAVPTTAQLKKLATVTALEAMQPSSAMRALWSKYDKLHEKLRTEYNKKLIHAIQDLPPDDGVPKTKDFSTINELSHNFDLQTTILFQKERAEQEKLNSANSQTPPVYCAIMKYFTKYDPTADYA